MLSTTHPERTGYPTQKPLKHLDRIIRASSNKGDIVFDPFCGCATTCVAAEYAERNWIGCDIDEKAAELVELRIEKELGTLFIGEVRADAPNRTEADLTDEDNNLFANIRQIRYNSPYNKYTLYGKQNGICNGCGLSIDYKFLEVDHIIPQAKDGTDHISNLQLLCSICNKSKGAMSMDDFNAKKQADLEAQLHFVNKALPQ